MKVVRTKTVSLMMAGALVISPLLSTLLIPTKISAEDIIVNNEEVISEEYLESDIEESESLEEEHQTSEANDEEVAEEEPIEEEPQENEYQAGDSTDGENDSSTDSENGEDGDGENYEDAPPSTEEDDLIEEEDSDIEENGNDEETIEEEEEASDEEEFEYFSPSKIELNESTISFAHPLSLDKRTMVAVYLDNHLMNDEDFKVYESLFISADDMSNMIETGSYLVLMLEEELDSWFHNSLVIPSSIFSGNEDVLITKKILNSGVSEIEKTEGAFQLTITEGNETIDTFEEPILIETVVISEEEIPTLQHHYYQDGYWFNQDQNGMSYNGVYWQGDYYDLQYEYEYDNDGQVIVYGLLVYGSIYHTGIFGLAEEGALTLGSWTEPEDPEENDPTEEDPSNNQPDEDPIVDEEEGSETGETETNEESGSTDEDKVATPVSSSSDNNDNGNTTLPNTATNVYNQLLLGAILILGGGVVLFGSRKIKRRQRPYVIS
ncbi:LPXTG cell wall anchor domain-containing protein [Evansella cellulosilytica]|uniref:LPXTG-motif cell wall anchor domain protein n=1 Tax=Evansella cellulosilytica (strain ATCC 21833 / DSM 2522 / FERM P-1141 / JCM 9156 / N-4) TaxID=649639 RepID=E6TUU4_EVAC2|nr:LPXTG cell wall anchor domain-containing protein [Evansella cellulosilytica]ADU32096.1 LPXTG-motif cell wall anchor domain protein [Evansella cellulosilytica DSM 2522]